MGSRLTNQQLHHRQIAESDLQAQFVKHARRNGWIHMHVSDSRMLRNVGGKMVLVGDPECKGWPDIFACHPDTGRVIAVEIKREREQPTPEQRRWLDVLASCGIETFVLRPSNWTEAIDLLGCHSGVAA